MRNTWVSLHLSLLHNHRFTRLRITAKGAYLQLLLLAGMNPDEETYGYIAQGSHHFSDHEIAEELRIRIKSWFSYRQQLIEVGLLISDEKGLLLHKFREKVKFPMRTKGDKLGSQREPNGNQTRSGVVDTKGLTSTPCKTTITETYTKTDKTPLSPQGAVASDDFDTGCNFIKNDNRELMLEAIWGVYPTGSRQARTHAFKAIRKALKVSKKTGREMLTIVIRFNLAIVESSVRPPLLATWFNQARYETPGEWITYRDKPSKPAISEQAASFQRQAEAAEKRNKAERDARPNPVATTGAAEPIADKDSPW